MVVEAPSQSSVFDVEIARMKNVTAMKEQLATKALAMVAMAV